MPETATAPIPTSDANRGGVGDKPGPVFMTMFILVVLSILVCAVLGVWWLVRFVLAEQVIADPKIRAAITFALLGVATILYMIKKRAQWVYGLAEVAVGLVANWNSLAAIAQQSASGSGSVFGRLAVLAGGVYLLGRGVANVDEGFRRINW
mgnify:CR=1 FL=1